MARRMTETDYQISEQVIDEKDNPTFEAVCPYCNTKIAYLQHGGSYETKCQTKNCFHFTYRGI